MLSTIREIIDGIGEGNSHLTAIKIKKENDYQQISFGELKAAVETLGNVLLEMGIKKNDKIGLLSENRPEWTITYLAVTSIGAIIVPYNIFLKRSEFQTVIDTSDVSLIFTSSMFLSTISSLRPELAKKIQLVCFDDGIDETGKDFFLFSRLLVSKKGHLKGNENYKSAEVTPDDIAVILFVSNKLGVMLSHKSITSNVLSLIEQIGLENDLMGCGLAVLPFNSTYPTFAGILSPILTNSVIVHLSTSRIKKIIETIRETGANYVALVPVLLERLYQYLLSNTTGEFSKESFGIGSLKFLFVAGAPMSRDVIDGLESFGVRIIEGYGLTETGPFLAFNSFSLSQVGSVGLPLSNVQLKIDNPDEAGNGEILVKGDYLMSGYYKLPNNPDGHEAGEVFWDNDEWLHTGDIGRFGENGFLYISGRSRNIIVTKGGSNIYPREIEATFKNGEHVSDVIVTRKVGEKGERPHAIIYVDRDALSLTNKEDEAIEDVIRKAYLRVNNEMADYKVPDTYEITFDKKWFDECVIKNRKNSFPELRSLIDKDENHKEIVSKEHLIELKKKIKQYLIRQIANVLEETEAYVVSGKNFMDLGLVSSDLLMLAKTFEKDLRLQFNPTLFFEYKNIAAFSDYIACEHADYLTKLFDIRPGNIQTQIVTKKTLRKKPNDCVIDTSTITPKNISAHITTNNEQYFSEKDIAIIGLSGRYPMANNIQAFWENIKEGKHCIVEFPKERWEYLLDFDESVGKHGETAKKWGGFIDDIDKFDPLFFNLSPRESSFIAPEERLFLETAWHTVEDAGYSTHEFMKRQKKSKNGVGVFVGGSMYHQYPFSLETRETSSLLWSIANRVSYIMNLSGPSLAIDSACSSSLTAIHMACESIKRGECCMALVGGVNLTLHPSKYKLLQNWMMLSSGDKSNPLGNGDGSLPGEGVGAVLLKPLHDAISDRDHIYAVIKSSCINSNARSNGFRTPDPIAQENLIVEAIQKADIDPATISWVEVAANGSALGDAIEIKGLIRAFKRFTDKAQFCRIGTVKSIIGNTEAASGIAQIIKVALQMKHKKMAPTINSDPSNPAIQLDGTPFTVQKAFSDWPQPEVQNNGVVSQYPRRAGINSFGAGGANAHLILEEYEDNRPQSHMDNEEPKVFIFSAKNKERLKVYVGRMLDFVVKNETLYMKDIEYTLQVGRDDMEVRLAIVASDRKEFVDKCNAFLKHAGKEITEGLYVGSTSERDNSLAQLINNTPDRALVKSLIENREVNQIAQLWSSGVRIDWELYHNSNDCFRISLPVYPFERRRCWIDDYDDKYHHRNELLNLGKYQNEASFSTITEYLTHVISLFLGMMPDEMDVLKPFETYGFDSIKTVNLKYLLETDLDIKIPMDLFATSRTIEEMGKNIHSNIKYADIKKNIMNFIEIMENQFEDQELEISKQIIEKFVTDSNYINVAPRNDLYSLLEALKEEEMI